jgi:TatD DNase family protein
METLVGPFDMHIHMGWAADPAMTARGFDALGMGAFAVTVTPEDYGGLEVALEGAGVQAAGIRRGLGLHPWYLDEAQLDAFLGLAPKKRYIGEIGLDRGSRHADTFDTQVAAFERVCDALAGGEHVLSIHAVRSVTEVMDALERHGVDRTSECIIHWFHGTSDELVRARRMGLWFSVSTKMLATKKGRAYVRQIPPERLLLETDEPEVKGVPIDADNLRAKLEATLDGLAQVLGRDVSARVAENSRALLGL